MCNGAVCSSEVVRGAPANTGADPDTGKPVLKTVSIRGVDPDLLADDLKTVGDLLTPLFTHPVIAVEKSEPICSSPRKRQTNERVMPNEDASYEVCDR